MVLNLLYDFPVNWWPVEQKFMEERPRKVRKCYYHTYISFPTKCGSADEFEMHTFSLMQVILLYILCTFTCTILRRAPTELIIICILANWKINPIKSLSISRVWWLRLINVRRNMSHPIIKPLLFRSTITVKHPNYR